MSERDDSPNATERGAGPVSSCYYVSQPMLTLVTFTFTANKRNFCKERELGETLVLVSVEGRAFVEIVLSRDLLSY